MQRSSVSVTVDKNVSTQQPGTKDIKIYYCSQQVNIVNKLQSLREDVMTPVCGEDSCISFV
jgi:hypothetical protein